MTTVYPESRAGVGRARRCALVRRLPPVETLGGAQVICTGKTGTLTLGARSDSRSLWELGVLSNLRLAAVVAVSYALQIVIHHVPSLAALFGITPVSLDQCLAWTALGAVPLVVLELRKLWLPASAPAAAGV